MVTAATTNDTTTSVRVVGSNYTVFAYAGKPIMFLEQVQDSGQAALSDNGQGWEFIHPLGYTAPTEIATSRAIDGGVLTLTVRETWNIEVWEQLKGLDGAHNILDIFDKLAQTPQYVTCTSLIYAPGSKSVTRGKIYHNCVVVQIQDGDNITIGALSVPKQIRVAYTYTTDYGSGSAGNTRKH